jgi:ornithine carbamoyltransferase
MRHFLNLIDITTDELKHLLSEAARLKAAHKRRIPTPSLAGRVVALIFEKPSMRTRVSFEAGIAQLGGTALFLPGNEIGLGWRETFADFSRTMSRFVDAMVFRVFKHATLDAIAAHATVPVVNGLSDWSHPCQALADVLTIQEHLGGVDGKTVAFVGDGNNVARSLAVAVGRLGGRFVLACPKGYGFDDKFRQDYRAKVSTVFPQEVTDPLAAVASADVIYTDVWTSMGQEAERDERLRKFDGFQVNAKLLAAAPKHCKVLHCLPAHRGEEITDEVVDGPQSVVFDEAENRLHVQKALLEWLLK